MCGRLRVGKSFFHVLQHWSVQPCVRPFDAVHMTAGHNALRGSGPDQKHAFDSNAMAQVGCPDRRTVAATMIPSCKASQAELRSKSQLNQPWPNRLSISSLRKVKSMGLVSNPLAPPSIAFRLVSGSP